MKLDMKKVEILKARNKLSIADMAERYGVSRARMNVILGQREVTALTAVRLAEALGVDVTEILSEE